MEKEDWTTWQQIDHLLTGPHGCDLWSDYLVEVVDALMQKLTPAEFAALRDAWRNRPPDWQVRCSGTLPWTSAASASRMQIASVLLEMTQFPNDELAITAADVLREFDPVMVAASVTPEMVQRLHEVAGRNPGLSAGAIHRFLRALPLAAP